MSAKVCDYSGYSCQCTGYKADPSLARDHRCVCGHAKRDHQKPSTLDKTKDKIEAYLRDMKPLESIGKPGLAQVLFGDDHQVWSHEQQEEFDKALRSVLRKLKKEGVEIRTWGGWIHR